MTWEAVDEILDKAWETDSQAFIYLKGKDSHFSICPSNHEWKIYSNLGLLCVHVLGLDDEYYIDVDKIVYIHIT